MSEELSYTEERNVLREEILELISWQKEGGYWDFKREWYSKTDAGNKELLKDLLSMSNNLCNRDAYIIIGIDEQQDFSIIDVCADTNRRKTIDINNVLRTKQFAGNNRPDVSVESISIEQKEIDVIVIKNSYKTPFYLEDDISDKIKKYCICTRVNDSNRLANIAEVEQLWRKRFHLDETPLEKFSYYLQQTDLWEGYLENGCEYKYFKPYPEYTIKYDDGECGNRVEFYMLLNICKTPIWHCVKLCYHQTILRYFLYNSLDEGRCCVVVPDLSGISFEDNFEWDISYFSYCRNSLEYVCLYFLLKEYNQLDSYQFANFMKVILFFDNDLERKNFENYVKNNKTRYEELYKLDSCNGVPWGSYEINGYDMEHLKKQYYDALVLQKMLVEFREKRDKLIVSAKSSKENAK